MMAINDDWQEIPIDYKLLTVSRSWPLASLEMQSWIALIYLPTTSPPDFTLNSMTNPGRNSMDFIAGTFLSFTVPFGKYGRCCEHMDKRRASFPRRDAKATEPLQRVHADIKGRLIRSKKGLQYYLLIVDEATDYIFVAPLRDNRIFDDYRDFVSQFERQTGKLLKEFVTDAGTAFQDPEFLSWNREKGILIRPAAPRAPEMNGRAERRIQTVQRMLRKVLKQSTLPNSYWPEALSYVAYTLNRIPSSKSSKTPFELMFNRKPFVGHLLPFGCCGFRLMPPLKRKRDSYGVPSPSSQRTHCRRVSR
mmetsp:Transcript_23604/g.35354  ORF Transcript_23604/g.35354 Transcript_23604/m.35354 type:complete len:306 (+) Transcript_23604:3127-4044(+)